MHIDNVVDLVKFVEATVTGDQDESFASQLLHWRDAKMKVTALIGSPMVWFPIILSVCCINSCYTNISILDTFWGTIALRWSWDTRLCKTQCLATFLWTRGSFHRQKKETQENYHIGPHGLRLWQGCALWVYPELYSIEFHSHQPPTGMLWWKVSINVHLRQSLICTTNKGTFMTINSNKLRKYIWYECIVVINFQMCETNCIKNIFLDPINKKSDHFWNKCFEFGNCSNLCCFSAFVVKNRSELFSEIDLRKENYYLWYVLVADCN